KTLWDRQTIVPTHHWTERELDRNVVYKAGFKASVIDLARTYPILYATYNDFPWAHGYGGRQWLNCTQATHSFYAAASNFIRHPDADHYQWLIVHWNRAVDMVHNGGTPIS